MQQLSFSKNNRLLLKFGIALLFLGLAFRFFYSSSTEFEPDLGASFVDKQQVQLPSPQSPRVSFDIPENEDQIPLGKRSISVQIVQFFSFFGCCVRFRRLFSEIGVSGLRSRVLGVMEVGNFNGRMQESFVVITALP